jgi:hypothetical protein
MTKNKRVTLYADMSSSYSAAEVLAWAAFVELERRCATKLVRQLVDLGFKGEVESVNSKTVLRFDPEGFDEDEEE